MNGRFQGFTVVWELPAGQWAAWVAARSRAHAGICALITFAVLERQTKPTSSD